MTSSHRPNRTFTILFGLLILLGLIAGVFLGYRTLRRGQDYLGRPLVLITSPADGERVTLGQAALTLAQARSPSGVARIELWAEGMLIAAEDAPEGQTYSPMGLTASWAPTTLGEHTLTARAFTAHGLAGYASLRVEVVPAAHVPPAAPAESQPGTAGESPDGTAADPGAGSAAPSPSDARSASDGTAQGAEPGDSEAPAALRPLELLGGVVELSPLVPLRLEALRLEAAPGYESLHCYAGLADQPPAWVPDTDGNPTTNESFAALSRTEWDIATHFAGDAARLLTWPGDQALPFSIACVGVRAGGSDAVALGQLSLSIPPAEWTGERRRVRAEDEGDFTLEYAIGLAATEPKGLDTSMAAPYNLHYDDRRQELHWDYSPRTEPDPEPAIDGFLVFLNDNLVWEVDADERQSRLPEAWLTPPCGESYEFTVRAFHRPYPDAPYSEESAPVTFSGPEPGAAACNRSFVVAFRYLNLYDLGDDGDGEEDMMGPIGGAAVVNDVIRHEFGNPPTVSVHNDSRFNLDTFFWDDYSEANVFFVTLAEGDDLRLAFVLDDHDRDRWFDGTLCAGGHTFQYDELVFGPIEGDFDVLRGGEDQVRCNIEYSIEPAPGSPVGVAGAGPLLPWLDLTEVTVDDATGELQLHLTNTGSAAWANHDLDVRVTDRAGEETGTHTWPLFYLDPLQEVVLQHPSLTADTPEAACVHLDYNDRVLESLEYTGMLHHGALCTSLPDLIVEDVQYERDDAQLQVTIRNRDFYAPLEDRVVSIDLLRPDGSPITPPLRPTVAFLDSAQSMTITWPSISPEVRREMLQGYTVWLNREGSLLEDDLTNNSYSVPAGESVWVVFDDSIVTVFYRDWRPWWADYPVHHFVISFSVTVTGGESSQRIGHWTQDFDWEPETDDGRHREGCNNCSTEQVALGGDERLVLGAAASVRKQGSATREDLGSWSNTFDILDPDLTYPRSYGPECLWGQEGHHEAITEGLDHTAGEYVLPRDWGVAFCALRLRD